MLSRVYRLEVPTPSKKSQAENEVDQVLLLDEAKRSLRETYHIDIIFAA